MEKVEKNLQEKDMIALIYKAQEEKIDKRILKINKELKSEMKSINTEKVIENANEPQELKKIFNAIEDNYNIKIAKYNESVYKQGFIDGINLMINCIK